MLLSLPVLLLTSALTVFINHVFLLFFKSSYSCYEQVCAFYLRTLGTPSEDCKNCSLHFTPLGNIPRMEKYSIHASKRYPNSLLGAWHNPLDPTVYGQNFVGMPTPVQIMGRAMRKIPAMFGFNRVFCSHKYLFFFFPYNRQHLGAYQCSLSHRVRPGRCE